MAPSGMPRRASVFARSANSLLGARVERARLIQQQMQQGCSGAALCWGHRGRDGRDLEQRVKRRKGTAALAAVWDGRTRGDTTRVQTAGG